MEYTSRRVASGGTGGNAPPDFRFFPPDFFLAPHGIFLGGRSWCFWAEKMLKFAISARKSLRISAKTFFFFPFWRSPDFGRKFVISARKSFRISARKSLRILAKTFFFCVGKFVISGRKSLRISVKTFAPLNLILSPHLAKLATPLYTPLPLRVTFR